MVASSRPTSIPTARFASRRCSKSNRSSCRPADSGAASASRRSSSPPPPCSMRSSRQPASVSDRSRSRTTTSRSRDEAKWRWRRSSAISSRTFEGCAGARGNRGGGSSARPRAGLRRGSGNNQAVSCWLEISLIDLPIDAAAPHQLSPQERAGDDLLAPALRRARWTIFWERLWPALASIATVIGLFLALSWLGLWLWLPSAARAIGLGVFFLLTAAAFAPVLMLRVPSRIEGLRRLDRNSGLPHRPATAIADEIAAPTEDSYSVALWRAHIERALRAAKTLRAGTPMPRLALRDPFAVRALVVVLVVATFFAAGGERMKRVAAAFDWQGVMMPANFRVDAWVSPPPYTGRPPIILPGLRPGEPVQTAAALSVPAGSTLVVRATGIHLDVVASGGLAEPPSGAQSSNAKGTEERRFVINDAGAATVRGAAASDVT